MFNNEKLLTVKIVSPFPPPYFIHEWMCENFSTCILLNYLQTMMQERTILSQLVQIFNKSIYFKEECFVL